MRRWIGRLVWGLGVLAGLALVVAVAVATVYGGLATPVASGTLTVAGAPGAVTITRDTHGIPTIEAADAAGLYYGLGFAHAQDRLWQLETHRRIGSGRLAEAFGPAALDTDRFLRALGVRRTAQAQWARLSAPSRDALQHYTDGINAYLHQHLRARPPEFVLLGLPVDDWSPVDSLAWATMMAWDLGGNWGTELLRLRLALKLPVSRIQELLPPAAGDPPLPTGDYAALYRSLGLAADLGRRAQRSAPESGVEGVGSNNWVLAPTRTTTGAPLLANDPHLKLSAPALWYFARLKAPGLEVAGATMPGLPHVVLGQNADIAWGFTNTAPDVQDLFLEQIDPADPGRYRTPDGWARFERFDEVIRVRGGADVRLTVRRTRHGPVISDAGLAATRAVTHPPAAGGPAAAPAYAVALQWTALAEDIDGVAPGLAMQAADSVATFAQAASTWPAPMQNMVVADRAGRIGFLAPGRVPVRAATNELVGQAPAPGWDARYDWQGFLPASALPQAFDPAQGYLATANQRVVAADHPHYLTSEWAPAWRLRRIEQMIAERERHSLDDLARMQADRRSLAVQPVLPWLQRAQARHALNAAAHQALQGFDGEMRADAAAPLIFWAFTRQFTRALFEDDIGAEIDERSYREGLEGVLARNDARWCDDQRTPAAETCAGQADAALAAALDELRARLGDDVAAWRWDAVHQARSEHRPFSKLPALAWLFELKVPVGGDSYTVNVSRVSLRADGPGGARYGSDQGPSMRGLYDLADRTQSRVMQSTGQPGLPWSRHYRDFVQPWAQVAYVPLWPAQAGADVLQLVPAP